MTIEVTQEDRDAATKLAAQELEIENLKMICHDHVLNFAAAEDEIKRLKQLLNVPSSSVVIPKMTEEQAMEEFAIPGYNYSADSDAGVWATLYHLDLILPVSKDSNSP